MDGAVHYVNRMLQNWMFWRHTEQGHLGWFTFGLK